MDTDFAQLSKPYKTDCYACQTCAGASSSCGCPAPCLTGGLAMRFARFRVASVSQVELPLRDVHAAEGLHAEIRLEICEAANRSATSPRVHAPASRQEPFSSVIAFAPGDMILSEAVACAVHAIDNYLRSRRGRVGATRQRGHPR